MNSSLKGEFSQIATISISTGPYILSFLVKTWVLSAELQPEIFGTVI
jgi:hypothetical protein